MSRVRRNPAIDFGKDNWQCQVSAGQCLRVVDPLSHRYCVAMSACVGIS